MEQENSSSPRLIQEEKAAQLLLDLEQLELVLPFMGQERNIADVAKELDMAVDAMTYRVKRLVKLGILSESRKKARKGRAITYYQTDSAFFVPVKIIPNQTTEDLFLRSDVLMRKQIAQSMTRALYEAVSFENWGVLIQRDVTGHPQLGLTPPGSEWRFDRLLEPDAPALLSSWMPLKLEFEDAKALQADLFELIGKYAQKQGSQTYLLGLSLAPNN
ncbi:MAG: hypothetical protein KC422_18890 [Trueperaceae bacterium]|nr:hypothetical protein [Trueperaceae bacterium]